MQNSQTGPTAEQIEVKRLFAFFPKSPPSPETLFVYAEALSRLPLRGLRDTVTWFGENWTRDTVPSVGQFKAQAATLGAMRERTRDLDEPDPVVFAEWERGLDFAVDPMPHGRFIRNLTLPDDSIMRVMSEDLIGPDGVHRGYPNNQSREWNAAWDRAHPERRGWGTVTMAAINKALEPGWNG